MTYSHRPPVPMGHEPSGTAHPSFARQASRRDADTQTRTNYGRTRNSLLAPVQRAVGALDGHIIAVALAASAADAQQIARLEVSLTMQLRRGLMTFAVLPAPGAGDEETHIDTVLAEGALDAVEMAQSALADLEAGGARRWLRLVSHCRELLGTLTAMGAPASPDWRKAREQLGAWLGPNAQPPPPAALGELFAMWTALTTALNAACPRTTAPTLWERWTET